MGSLHPDDAARARLDVLVTGGAGYIGSFVVRHLLDAGHRPVVYDNLYAGHRWAAQELSSSSATSPTGASWKRCWRRGASPRSSCAAHIWVGRSVREPASTTPTTPATRSGCSTFAPGTASRNVVFSSTTAVYRGPDMRCSTSLPTAPINPYGASKAMAERVLADVAAAAGLRHATLRYFNVAGADADARIGEATPDNAHLVKVACETALGLRPGMRINGTDYPTPDGTCIRDYVHVDDLARAHLLALHHLAEGARPSSPTAATATASACARCWTRRAGSPVWRSRSRRARAGPATRRCWSPTAAASRRCSAGRPGTTPGLHRRHRVALGAAAAGDARGAANP